MASKYLISSRQYRTYTSVYLVGLVASLYCLAKNYTGQDRNIAVKFVLTASSLTNNSYLIKNVYYKIVYVTTSHAHLPILLSQAPFSTTLLALTIVVSW